MNKLFLLLLVSLIAIPGFSRDRNYLLHTDENIARLKENIKKDTAVSAEWNRQYLRAVQITENNRLTTGDCQLLGLAYRMTGENRFAEAIKKILLENIKGETWENAQLLDRTPPWKGAINSASNGYAIAIGFDCAYNYLSKEERMLIAKGLVRLGIDPVMKDWVLAGYNMHTFDTMALIHALSKYTALVENFNGDPSLKFDGQPFVTLQLHVPKNQTTLTVNNIKEKGKYDSNNKTLQFYLEN
ncbi:MAG TPA: hypothetical protein VMV77_20320 [Bacteroidales bacterium]|nr:hypothetical protein [Bacteroidales bacterium]